MGGFKALVFCNSPNSVRPIVEDLQQRGYPVEGISYQTDRDDVCRSFATPGSGIELLVCHQIFGRHDFRNVRYVINFDMPTKIVEYVHRIGRIINPGQQRYSLTLLTEEDLGLSRDLLTVLRESQQDIPEWLRQRRRGVGAGGHSHSYQGNSHGQRHFHSAEFEEGSSKWTGRGRGRRNVFLSFVRIPVEWQLHQAQHLFMRCVEHE